MNKKLIFMLAFIVSLPALTCAQGLMVYKPPQTGAPEARVGGGTRQFNLNKSKILTLAPQHTALTGQAQPVLYWYLPAKSQQPIEVKLDKEGGDKPLLEKQLPSASRVGLQSLRLADYGVSLQAGQKYRWYVSIVTDAESNPDESIASASLLYQPLPAGTSSVEKKAETGYWYDALRELIDSHSPLANDLLKQIDIKIPDL